MKRRLYALLLAVCVTVTGIPQNVSAATPQDEKAGKGADIEELKIINPAGSPEVEGNTGGYVRVPFDLPEVKVSETDGVPAQKDVVVPDSYDGRNKIGPVRDQDPYGTCWTFAAMAAAEASMVSKGIADTSIDLSEYQVARFFYNNVNDPLGNTAGDKTVAMNNGVDIQDGVDVNSRESYLDVGGNSVFTTWSMAGWKAGAAESTAPYTSIASTNGILPASVAFNDIAHMQNAYWIPMSTDSSDQQLVKKMIMQYGAVATSYMHDDDYYNPEKCAYYNSSRDGGGHAISIVGWNDNFSRTNFKEDCQPYEDGAWLVRNSWGSYWGQNGYFWMSYEDVSLTDKGLAFVFDFEKADNYKYNYQYDGSNGSSYLPIDGGVTYSNVYKVFGNSKQLLEAISVGMYSSNTAYSIQIYLNPKNGDPTSGTPLLKTPQTGRTTYTGYHTIDLQEDVILYPGETFAVEVTLPVGGYMFVDATDENGDWLRFESATEPNQSYVIFDDEIIDMSQISGGVSARIKAFTNDYNGTPVYTQEISKADADGEIDGKITYKVDGREYQTDTIYAPSEIKFSQDTFIYNGKVQKPSVSVYDRAGHKIDAAHYTVIYEDADSKETGYYDVIVVFKSDKYRGSLQKLYTIEEDEYTIEEDEYTTEITKADASKKKNGKISYLVNGEEYKSETIYAPSKIKFSKDTLSYNGKSQKPSVKVYDTKGKKISSSNYTVSYEDKNSKMPDSYGVKVTFKGSKYKGTLKKDYKIAIDSVSGFKASPKSASSIKLSWKKQKNASGYYLYAATSEKGKYKKIAEFKKNSNTSYTYSRLKSGKTYYFKIQAYKKIGKKTYKSAYSTAVTATKPGKVTGLKTSSVKKTSLKLSWKKVSGASGYQVYRYNSAKKKYEKIADTKKNYYTDKSLKKNKTYKYQVRAYRKVGKSTVTGDYSSVRSVKTKK